MTKRIITSLIMALVLVTSLTAGTVVSGAQQPPDLTKTYSWQSHGLSIAYPTGWMLTEGDTAVRLRPAGRDVSDGYGPELVLFEQPDTTAQQFETAIADLAASFGAESEITARTTLNGSTTMHAALTWNNPAAHGEIMLIAAETEHALGVAYVARDSEEAAYHDALVAMFDSVTLGAITGTFSSSSVTSVQLQQDYAWGDAGLLLHFPAAWTIDTETYPYSEILYAYPDNSASSAYFQATIFTSSLAQRDLNDVGDIVLQDYGEVLDSAEIMVADYDGMAYDTLAPSGEMRARVVLVKLTAQDALAVIELSANANEWDDFLPTASAFISGIEIIDAPTSTLNRVANTQPALLGGLPQQTEMKTFEWGDYGISVDIPSRWESVGSSEDYDLALVSAEALLGNAGGYLIFNVYPTLGTDITVENALDATAEEAGVEVEPFAPNGYGVKIIDETQGVEQNLILYPYNDHGAALFLQTSIPIDDVDTITAILDTLKIEPPSVDYAAADVAFQESLKEDGSLSYGDQDAPVNVTEFFSFTCSHCASYTLPMQNFVALDVESGNVRFTVAPLASDEKAILATHALYCAAEQGKGYSVYEALFSDYLANGYDAAYTEEAVAAILSREDFGLDQDTLNTCIEDEKYTPVINTARQAFIDFGLSGTPTIVMGAHGDDIAPVQFPDGTIWSGTMQIGSLRAIVASAVNDNISIQDAANQLFE